MRFYYVLISVGIILYCLHTFFLNSNYSSELTISLKIIYLYNLISVIFVCSILQFNSKMKNLVNPLGLFILITIIKMTTGIIILLAALNLEKENLFLDTMNFFAVYFIFQIAEVIGIKNVLK